MFDVDFNDIAVKLTPVFLRKKRFFYFLKACLKPLKSINLDFLKLRSNIHYRLLFNGQVIYLNHYLNDVYDPIKRRIYIDDVSNIDYNYVYNNPEQLQDLYLSNTAEDTPLYLLNYLEYIKKVHFIINIPTDVSYNELLLRSQVDIYRQAGKNYVLKII